MDQVNELIYGAAGVDPSNRGQLDAWNGETGVFWTEWADRFDAGVAAYREHLFAAAAIEPTAAVLDVGCGAGVTTRDAARHATAGSALGVDLSSRLLELARERARRERVTNVTFEQADAQVHPFTSAGFDIVISRHGTMFFGDPDAAFANLARALRPGGRLVLLTWQPLDRNEWIQAFRAALAGGRELPVPPAGAPGPFSLSDPDRVESLLVSAGFSDVRRRRLHEPMYFGADPDDAFRFVAAQHSGLVRDLDADSRARAFDRLRDSLGEHHTDQGVCYDSAAWLVHARRTGPLASPTGSRGR